MVLPQGWGGYCLCCLPVPLVRQPPVAPMQGFKERSRVRLAAAGTPQETEAVETAFTGAAYQHVLFLSTFTGFVAQAPLQLQHLQRCAPCRMTRAPCGMTHVLAYEPGSTPGRRRKHSRACCSMG